MKFLLIFFLAVSSYSATISLGSITKTAGLTTNTFVLVSEVSASDTNTYIINAGHLLQAFTTNSSTIYLTLTEGKVVPYVTNISNAEISAAAAIAATKLDSTLIVSGEIDTIAEIEAIAAGVNIITSTEIDTIAEIETLAGAVNIILATEIDTEGELETILGSINLLNKTAIDTQAEFEALLFALPSGSGSGAPVGTVVNTGASVANAIPIYLDTTGTNVGPSGVTITSLTNLSAGSFSIGTLIVTNDPAFGGVTVNPLAYNATTWNGSTNVPTRDDVRDVIELKANIASPTFTGDPLAPTPAANDNDTSLMTSAGLQTELTAYATDTVSFQSKDLTHASNVLPAEIGIAISDETTDITTGTGKAGFRMPFAMTVTSVRASLRTASSSGLPAIDINEGGVSIFSTTLTLDVSELTTTTALTAAVLSDTTLADDAAITIDIDTAGTGAAGLKIWIIGTR